MSYQYMLYQVDRSVLRYLILGFPVGNDEEFDGARNSAAVTTFLRPTFSTPMCRSNVPFSMIRLSSLNRLL